MESTLKLEYFECGIKQTNYFTQLLISYQLVLSTDRTVFLLGFNFFNCIGLAKLYKLSLFQVIILKKNSGLCLLNIIRSSLLNLLQKVTLHKISFLTDNYRPHHTSICNRQQRTQSNHQVYGGQLSLFTLHSIY